jgi:carbon monoxide dehydrogenase subunit G
MITVEKSIQINKPAAEVFAFMSDFANDMKWQSGLIRSEQTSDGPMGVGTTGLYVQKFMGKEMKNEVQVTAYEPPTRFAVKTTSGPVQFEFTGVFQETGGGTQVDISMKGEASGFFKVAEGMIKAELEKTLDADFIKLKKLLEG